MIITDTDTDSPDSRNRDLLRIFGRHMVKGTARCLQCGEAVTTIPTMVLFGQGVTGLRLADAESTFLFLHLECASEFARDIRTQAVQVLGDNWRRRQSRFRTVTQQWLRELDREALWEQWLDEASTAEEREAVQQCITRERTAHEKLRALNPTA